MAIASQLVSPPLIPLGFLFPTTKLIFLKYCSHHVIALLMKLGGSCPPREESPVRSAGSLGPHSQAAGVPLSPFIPQWELGSPMKQLLVQSSLHPALYLVFSTLPLSLLPFNPLSKALFNHVDFSGHTCLVQQSLLPAARFSVVPTTRRHFPPTCEDWANARWLTAHAWSYGSKTRLYHSPYLLPFDRIDSAWYRIMNSFRDGFESDILMVNIVSCPSNVSLLPYQWDLYFIQHSSVSCCSGLILNISKSGHILLSFHYSQHNVRRASSVILNVSLVLALNTVSM